MQGYFWQAWRSLLIKRNDLTCMTIFFHFLVHAHMAANVYVYSDTQRQKESNTHTHTRIHLNRGDKYTWQWHAPNRRNQKVIWIPTHICIYTHIHIWWQWHAPNWRSQTFWRVCRNCPQSWFLVYRGKQTCVCAHVWICVSMCFFFLDFPSRQGKETLMHTCHMV
jgi:hypothetical protein